MQFVFGLEYLVKKEQAEGAIRNRTEEIQVAAFAKTRTHAANFLTVTLNKPKENITEKQKRFRLEHLA